ncbi:7735_t:CDS:10 [Ambispora gerdemannii]|uniref:SWR1-complex protein 4 n=1 Tax=Ambispora gerdemannii TaxID=144530 RepID=A0A9N9AK96_9GLOM|nr:7735_t:CDS:10 [Ambispora gerdemannii]
MSNDVRDILGLSGLSAEGSVKKPMRIEKEKKPDGISRELFQLIGGPPPVAFIKPAFKAKPNLRKKAVAWNYRAFKNPARGDDLELRHWVKASEDENQAYRFNEFNKVINILDYTEQEYNNLLNSDPDWTKAETDYLFELCRNYDLRFLVISDRYEWPDKRRTMEDLKERYYFVMREVNTSRAGSGVGSKDNIASMYNFDKAREIERKNNLQYLFTRNPDQIKEEEVLLQEYERIEQNEKKFSKERENLLKMLNFQDINPSKSLLNGGPSTPTADTSGAFFANSAESPPNKKMRRSSSSSVGTSSIEVHSPTDAYPPNTPRREKLPPGVVVRSQKIPPVKQSAINKVTKYLAECHLNTRPNMATETVCAKWAELQKGIVNMLELKRHVEKLENDLDAKKKLLVKAKTTSTTQIKTETLT